MSIIDTEIGATIAMWLPERVDNETSGEFRLRPRPRRKKQAAAVGA